VHYTQVNIKLNYNPDITDIQQIVTVPHVCY